MYEIGNPPVIWGCAFSVAVFLLLSIPWIITRLRIAALV